MKQPEELKIGDLAVIVWTKRLATAPPQYVTVTGFAKTRIGGFIRAHVMFVNRFGIVKNTTIPLDDLEHVEC